MKVIMSMQGFSTLAQQAAGNNNFAVQSNSFQRMSMG
eukprot:CAMPEP_0185163848 /NCGR_PEP_ID=MMETSP1139-20130426/8571_1 /TAXON_ID=298111 /ORGANISM="Pavlova sp., Strain CCMP459" /LENGTH=36 /DNA_ID= /DNA_START= /DNA_END= /DNA_ORIENTATION=